MKNTAELSSVEERLKSLGIELPPAPKPAANYVAAAQSGSTVYLAGQGPIVDGKVVYGGKIGADLSEEAGYQAARLTILNSLAVLREHAGSLDRVARILKLTAWVNCVQGFQRHHIVMNGASDLLVELFGPRGQHARSAVSAHELPFGIAVEIEVIAEVDFES